MTYMYIQLTKPRLYHIIDRWGINIILVNFSNNHALSFSEAFI